jgi:hypothetical protein
MKDEMNTPPGNLTTPYTPVAIYYEDADMVEYVCEDIPFVCKRVDNLLTLIFSMKKREELVGFRLKGFKNYYLHNLSALDDFVSLVGILEREVTKVGNEAFEQKEAYKRAREIAVRDHVVLKDLPPRTMAMA